MLLEKRITGHWRRGVAIAALGLVSVGILAATGWNESVAEPTSGGGRPLEVVASTDLQLGLIAALSAQLADSLYGRCVPAFSAARQGVDLSSPLDDYYSGLLLLRRHRFTEAETALRRLNGSGAQDKDVPGFIRGRAKLLVGACAAWRRGEIPASPPDADDAAFVEAWTTLLTGRWPDASRLGSAAGTTALQKLMLALARREADGVRAAVSDKTLYAVDYPKVRTEGGREFIDPLQVMIAARGYFFLAEDGFQRAAAGGQSAHLDGAAFAALLAGDSESVGAIVKRSDAASLQCYQLAVARSGAEADASDLKPSDDPTVTLAQARVLGFVLRDGRGCVDRYAKLISIGKDAARAVQLRREATVACLELGDYPTAFNYGDGLYQRDHNDPIGLIGRSHADLGRQGFKDFGAAALLQENLTIPGGLYEKFAFLKALKVSTWLYVRLHSPIDSQGAGVK